MPGGTTPFDRVFVDHLFHGTTRVWWQLAAIADPLPYQFQLQASFTGNENSLDWVNVGTAETNVTWLNDDQPRREARGKLLLTHYRVVLTTPSRTYVSPATPIWGTLSDTDWRLAREIVRKEQLRLNQVGIPGFLLRRMRYGRRNAAATDPLTGDVVDPAHPATWGTPFDVGYHPPVPCLVDMAPQQRRELRGNTPADANTRPDAFSVRVLASPDLVAEDVWVHATTDERYTVHDRRVMAAVRGYPLVLEAQLGLLPFGDAVYRIPVSPLSTDPTLLLPEQATSGTGCISVDHHYGGQDELSYTGGDCCPIEGAIVRAFRQADWDAGNRDPGDAVATVSTTTGGRWASAMLLDAGDYVLEFSKPGEYGPDTVNITVEAEPASGSSSSDFDYV